MHISFKHVANKKDSLDFVCNNITNCMIENFVNKENSEFF